MLQPLRNLSYRPSPLPGITSPVTVRSTGVYRLALHTESNPPRNFTQLFWVHTGQVEYRRQGNTYRCPSEWAFYYAPNEPHSITGIDMSGVYYWLTFDGSGMAEWLRTTGFQEEPKHTGECPVDLFNALGKRITDTSLDAEEDAASIGLRILRRVASASVSAKALGVNSTLTHQLEDLLALHFRDPEFGLEQAAKALGVHRTTLYRKYLSQRGIAPAAFLQRLRLQKGLELLKSSSFPIAEVAQASGFRDANYFTKVIGKATGECPRRLRKRWEGNLDLPHS